MLQTAFFPLQFMAWVWSRRAMNWSGKKQGVVTYSTERENEVSKIFIISLGNWIELESTPRSQAVRTLEYGPLNQPISLLSTWDIINRYSEISAILSRYHKVSLRLWPEPKRNSSKLSSWAWGDVCLACKWSVNRFWTFLELIEGHSYYIHS